MRPFTLVVLAFFALAPALAAAQAPSTTPTYTLTLTAPAAFGLLTANSSNAVTVSVEMVLSGVICPPGGETVPVTLTATPKGAPAFFSIILDPSVINMTIEQGPHGVGPAGPAGGTGDAQLKAIITGNITANASVPVEISASAPAPACQPSQSGATSETVTTFANMTAPPPPPAPEPEPKKGFLPGPGAFIGVVAASIAAASFRRKE